MTKDLFLADGGDSAGGTGLDVSPSVVVTIPVYRAEMSQNEEASFRRNTSVLGKRHPVVLFAPRGLDLTRYRKIFPGFQVEFFPDRFFGSIEDYSRLLLSEEFYERFSAYEWLLICQLDAWVLKDELARWCATSCDFWGAPISARWEFYMDGRIRDIVGNGGFSLRRISAFLKVLRAERGPMYTRKALGHHIVRHFRNGDFLRALVPILRMAGIGNGRRLCLDILRRQGCCEDMVFRALSSPELEPHLNFPSVREAADFALDGNFLRQFFEISGRRIPCGLHAWHQPEGMAFLRSLREKDPAAVPESVLPAAPNEGERGVDI